MSFLKELRDQNIVPQLKFSFTYQYENFRELRKFIDFCKGYSADFIILERLQNITFSEQEFIEKAVHFSGHPCYAEFIEIISDPVFQAYEIWHDFDYPGVQNIPKSIAKQRMREVAGELFR